MSSHVPGDVVFLDFPFTTPGAGKRRPALALLDAGNGDLLFARITSSGVRHQFDVALEDWQAAGLLAASHVKLAKLVTVSDSLVIRPFGRLTARDRSVIAEGLRSMFAVDWPPAAP